MSDQKSREFTAAEKQAIQEGLNQIIPKPFADYSTPLPEMLVSPIKNSFLKVFVQVIILFLVVKYTKITTKQITNQLSLKVLFSSPFVALFTLFFFAYPVLNYVGKVRSNNNILESMKRLPEGATKMDYISQGAVMSNRLRGGRGGFGSGFFGGMLGGSLMSRRRK